MKRSFKYAALFLTLSAGAAMAQTTQSSSKSNATGTVKDTVQSQGNSGGGTSAWPQSTGTAGGMRKTQESGSAVPDSTKPGESQAQGNSAGGTSAWPMSTGTTGSITPADSTANNVNGNQNEATDVRHKDKFKGKQNQGRSKILNNHPKSARIGLIIFRPERTGHVS